MTTTATTGEGTARVFLDVDHRTCECVGPRAAGRCDRFEAPRPLCRVREPFGRFEVKAAEGLTVRHDHGGSSLSDDFRRKPSFLGTASSPSFVREPEENGYAGRFIRAPVANLLWLRSFATVAELVEASREFKRAYNER